MNLDWPNFFAVLLALIPLLLISFLGIMWVYKNSKISWLNWTSLAIIFSFPFERSPSLDIMGLTLRFSQFFTMVSIFLVAVLFLKKSFTNFKWSPINYWFILLILATIPSIYFVENWSRWFVSMLATLIVFAAAFIIANFLESRKLAFFGLIFVLFFVGLFGYFQLFADFIGLPTNITLLKETYTKKVFGFARIHSTAAEPLYFAGMLFLPIYASLILYINSISKNSQKIATKMNRILNSIQLLKNLKFVESFLKKYTWAGKVYSLAEFIFSKIHLVLFGKFASNFFLGLLIFFAVLFILTIAKSAWLAIFLTLPLLIIFTWKIFNWKKFISQIALSVLLVIPIVYLAYVSIQPVRLSLDKVIQNFSETALGISSTSTERENFQNLAVSLLQSSGLIGIGSGQYGIESERPLRSLKTDKNQFFIVNNVYLEIWLEFGIVFLILFVSMFSWLLFSSFIKLKKLRPDFNSPETKLKNNLTPNNYIGLDTIQIIQLSLLLSIISYLIQWFSFSPIYIMPIFILLGLAFNLNWKHVDKTIENKHSTK
jgi:O-Antigen ligase